MREKLVLDRTASADHAAAIEDTHRHGIPPEAIQSVVTAFVVLFCIVGMALWGLPFYYDFMVQKFGWSRGQVTSGNALSKLVIGPIFGFLAGWIIDRFGPRRMMMAGVLMAGVALIGLGRMSSLSLFYLFYVFNALGYVCGGPLPQQVLLTQWFDRSRGKAMGIAYLGIGLGGATVPWISHALVKHFGWQTALQVLGVAIIVVSFPLAFLTKEAPPRARGLNRQVEGDAKRAFKSKAFLLLTAGSMCSVAAVAGTQQNMKLFLSLDRHYTQAEAARFFSIVLTCSIFGRLLMGWLADRFPKKYVMLLIYSLVAAGIPMLFLSQNPIVFYISAAIFGVGLGGDYMIVPLMTAEIFGMNLLGRLLGVMLTAAGVAEGLSPWFMGRLRDSTGSYLASCGVLVGIAMLGALTVLPLPSQRKTA